MEVIVTFLGGDLDRPIITGCVYNATHPPPFKLPDEKTSSGFRTSSTPDNAGANELSFNDAAGSEQFFVHATRNYDEVVENDRTSRTGGSSQSNVAVSSSDYVGGDASCEVAGTRTTAIGEADRVRVSGRSTTFVGGDHALEVEGDSATTIMKTHSLEVRANRSLVVGSPDEPAHSDHYVYGTASLAADERIFLRAHNGILLECGDASIELSADKIVLRAPTIEIAPSKTLSATTGGGPSLTMGEGIEILTKKLKIFTESGALELDTELKVKGDKIKLGYDPSKPDQDKQETAPETKPFQVKLSDYFLQPYASKKYHVMVEGLRFEGETDSDGVVKEDIPKDAKQVVVRLWIDDYPQGRQRLYTLKLGELPPVDNLRGAKIRLKNLGYYDGVIDDGKSDDLRLAVADFQDDHKDTHGLDATRELDTGTAGALEEVHGS